MNLYDELLNIFSKIFVTSGWERIHAFTASTAVWFQAAGDEDSYQWRIQGGGGARNRHPLILDQLGYVFFSWSIFLNQNA